MNPQKKMAMIIINENVVLAFHGRGELGCLHSWMVVHFASGVK